MEKIRIALADDHKMVREGIVSLLSNVDNVEVVAEAANGAELLAALEKPGFALPHICILDIQMPIMDGYATLMVLRQNYPAIRVLILSQFDDEFVVIKMLKEGARGYLKKDAGLSELRDAIGAIHKGSYYQNEMVGGHIFSLVQRNDEDAKLILSDSELTFLRYVCTQLTYKDIAGRMGISKRTVEGYRERLFEKLGATSRTSLVLFALKIGLTPSDDVDIKKPKVQSEGDENV